MSDLAGLLAIAADNTVSEVRLSPNTLAVLLYALGKVDDWRVWKDYRGEQIPEADIETIHDLVDEASYEVMNPIVITPIGSVVMWMSNTYPDKWLELGGQAISKTTYPELFDIFGYDHGGGFDMFVLPSYRGYSPYGAGADIDVQDKGGAATRQINVNNLPAHNHPVVDPGHTHALNSPFTSIIAARPSGTAAASAGTTLAGGASLVSNTTGITTGNTGSGDGINILHPVFAARFIIYAGR